MVRITGISSYSMADINRLLYLVEKTFPQGKDEWKRIAEAFNSNKPRGVPARDFENLRRKCKVLYGTRKDLTGMPGMPPHIKKAKEVEVAIDNKVSVVVLDDGADDDEQCAIELDLCFDVDPDDTFFEAGGGDGLRTYAGCSRASSERSESTATDASADADSAVPRESMRRGRLQNMLETPMGHLDLEDFVHTPRPTPARASLSARRVGSVGLPQPRKMPAPPPSFGTRPRWCYPGRAERGKISEAAEILEPPRWNRLTPLLRLTR